MAFRIQYKSDNWICSLHDTSCYSTSGFGFTKDKKKALSYKRKVDAEKVIHAFKNSFHGRTIAKSDIVIEQYFPSIENVMEK